MFCFQWAEGCGFFFVWFGGWFVCLCWAVSCELGSCQMLPGSWRRCGSCRCYVKEETGNAFLASDIKEALILTSSMVDWSGWFSMGCEKVELLCVVRGSFAAWLHGHAWPFQEPWRLVALVVWLPSDLRGVSIISFLKFSGLTLPPGSEETFAALCHFVVSEIDVTRWEGKNG